MAISRFIAARGWTMYSRIWEALIVAFGLATRDAKHGCLSNFKIMFRGFLGWLACTKRQVEQCGRPLPLALPPRFSRQAFETGFPKERRSSPRRLERRPPLTSRPGARKPSPRQEAPRNLHDRR